MGREATATGMELERPENPDVGAMAWGSDAIAQPLSDLSIPYIALNPGSSFRGLHDSLVNYLGNDNPRMILCLHEEHAVAIAHGFAKVAGRPMAVALHSNVGLMHASMAIFDAYCDRAPVIMLGATGPLDATARRPWIDWLHSCADQAAMIRPYIKWDDQPGSVPAAVDSMLRAHLLATTPPCGPVYVSLDVSLQERKLDAPLEIPDVERFARTPSPAHPAPEELSAVAARLIEAQRPVLLAGRLGGGDEAWNDCIELAERLGATVFTHLELPAAFPTEHPLCGGVVPSVEPSEEASAALRDADVVLSLDWLDLGGMLLRVAPDGLDAAIISVSVDQYVHNGWTKDHMAPTPADIRLVCDPAATVRRLLEDHLRGATSHEPQPIVPTDPPALADLPLPADGQLTVAHIAAALRGALGDAESTLVRVPSAWQGSLWPVRGPLDHCGGDGGGGLASAPGMAVGAALALRDSDRIPIAIIGDGDYLMGANALWTAAHYGLPLLVVVANNRSFLNDEMHQHRMAQIRDRPIANRWIGQRIDDPPPDLAAMARAQGAVGVGPVREVAELADACQTAIEQVRDGATVVVDVWVTAEPAEPAQGPWLNRPTG